MSQFPWQASYMPSYSTGGDEQIEALQTDVMRFMAIIGLCLMAIFSIVQSLPYQVAEKTPQVEVDKLQDTVSSMQNKIKQLDDTIREKQQAQQQLELLEKTLEKQRGQLTALNGRIQKEQQVLNQLQEKKPNPQPEKVVEEMPEIKKTVKQVAEKKGFSLRFASDQALLRLLQQQQVSLSVMMGKQVWKLSPKSTTGWRVIKAKQPKKYHQMAENTVPSVLRQAVRKELSVQNNSQVVWAVELPKLIVNSISQLVKNKLGGDLVIENNGIVRLKP